jgi:uncharacterized membrane-anchored protein
MNSATNAINAVRRQPLAVKVPEITLIFWVLKLLSTGTGEALSDFMGQQSVPIAGAIGIFGLAFALWLQLRSREYVAPLYWGAVMMVAVFGTMAADGIHDGADIPYSVTTPVFAAIVGLTFAAWYRAEGTLSIHSIDTRRRELFYWTAVLGTFALGTAAGDLTAYSLKLGFWASAALFGLVFAIPAIGWGARRLNPILAFWFAYVVTRPLGASFADGFSKPGSGGLNLGDGLVGGIGLLAFVVLVAYVTVSGRDRQPAPVRQHHPVHLPHPHVPHAHLGYPQMEPPDEAVPAET